jgi:hypothetical protein
MEDIMALRAATKLAKYSFGTGDRFGMQGEAQLSAVAAAAEKGVDLDIVWNKSHREHTIVGTSQSDVRLEADQAVAQCNWKGGYFVDADHINLGNVASFLAPSDFFTIDVADYIGEKANENELSDFVTRFGPYCGRLAIEGIIEPLQVTSEQLREIAEKYLFATQQAAAIYCHIKEAKGDAPFITEVSMDETETPQSPAELFFILAALANQGVPVQTIAPKFTGRFNKGVDYKGDVDRFNREFGDDVCVIKRAIADFGLPPELKLSVHSGSDKFSIYPGIRQAMATFKIGVHVKTAGTTWLEELIGLAEAGGEALVLVKKIYREAFGRFDELCLPYATVIDIDRQALPAPDVMETWTSKKLAGAIRHDQNCGDYDPNIRQLLHVGYKVAAEHSHIYKKLVQEHRAVVGEHVRRNLLERHIAPLFL